MSLSKSFIQVSEILAITAILHKIIPVKASSGYVTDFDGRPLMYKLNGLATLVSVCSFYGYMGFKGVKSSTYLYDSYGKCAASASFLGILASCIAFLHGKTRPGPDQKYSRAMTTDMTDRNGKIVNFPAMKPAVANGGLQVALLDFFLGHVFNPRIAGIDIKMLLYTWGAVILQLNLLSMWLKGRTANGGVSSRASTVYTCLFTWFVVEYMYHENVHLYTYDLFAEKIGFKLLWGCLFFYPFFYPIGGLPLAKFAPNANPKLAAKDLSTVSVVAITALFFSGWCITRGANLQKFEKKVNPEVKEYSFLGVKMSQETIPDTTILTSGFWGFARHINYFGEVLQAVALALPGSLTASSTTDGLLPWLYPLYYIALFIPRERDDDKLCLAKYGDKWLAYRQRVPSR
ncbi:hypothetical protein SmJEL517_g06062 [Synchytrium microbalum]|uniref:Steroid 5-alpha reductase C-terminal domain-containing protein n=1 Tax=Synchytrium microbalum TaxID=1806994 RepID=A0A507BYF8_9FUNG|nr:uncharacterized protein SmJEL517_g06062 [Synchytrium microbalum]TPX30375.1 hypothetical protein SmJEL517_g06062 [Synchytrium microbalum]